MLQTHYIRTGKTRLSDRDMLLDLLMTEKYMSRIYNNAALESTNEAVLEAFDEMARDEHNNARSLFEAMQNRGWYKQEPDMKATALKRGSRFSNKYNSNDAVTGGSKKLSSRLARREFREGVEYSRHNRYQ
jgi:spore coat protein CotF